MSDLIKLCGLWLNEKGGKKYFSGKLSEKDMTELARHPEGCKVLIFKNDRKERENQPDYNIMIAPLVEAPPAATTSDVDDDSQVPF